MYYLTTTIEDSNMMTQENGNAFHITGPFCEEFTADILHKGPVRRDFDDTWTNCWASCRVTDDLGHHDTHVTWL